MTAKRDFKRRVRERQARTGESYVTALHHVRAQAPEARPPAATDGAPSPDAIPVIELIDVTELGAPLGYKCRVTMQPGVAGKIDVAGTLTRFRDMLLATTRDRGLDRMRDVVLCGARPRLVPAPWQFHEMQQFYDRARAGLGGVSESGSFVAMSVDGNAGSLMLMFHLMLRALPYVVREPSLTLGELPPPSRGVYWEMLPW